MWISISNLFSSLKTFTNFEFNRMWLTFPTNVNENVNIIWYIYSILIFFNTYSIYFVVIPEENNQEATDVSSQPKHHPQITLATDLSPLIPESVEHINKSPEIPFNSNKVPIRPTQLDLGAPKRPARHLRPPSITGIDASLERSPGIYCWWYLIQ